MDRRTIPWKLCWLPWLLLAPQGRGEAALDLVRDGVALARIVVGSEAPASVAAAAHLLSDCVFEASGARLPVVKDGDEGAAEPGARVHVGRNRFPESLVSLPPGLDGDGFVILSRGRDVVILGPTADGTEFGVCEFLERFLGVRWLLPGEDGVDVPPVRTLTVPEGRMEEQPVFFSRQLSGLTGPAQAVWARRNRMHGRVAFHHNLLRLFPPSRYRVSHPEFYPVRPGGERYLPADDEDPRWQPCFTAPGIVEEAVHNIVQHFRERPQETSYSLGMNDSKNFCQCAQCLARISGARNYTDSPDYADLYYDWCNRVIEGVLRQCPDKWFGCLAYYNVATPPTRCRVHPRLVPYITYDRMKWIDPVLRAQGEQATRDWQRTVPAFAWYDYLYGTPYCLPRVYFRHAAGYLRFAADHGVKAHYAELYPNFGEGPKAYLQLRLWWNPRQDEDALLREWYERCVGPDAAPLLARYYGIWERFWTQDIRRSSWFTASGTWLPFNSPAYLADVPAGNIEESRRLLDACIAQCRTGRQRARARLLEMAFQYYEASAIAYSAGRPSPAGRGPASQEEALATLESARRGLEMAQRRRHLVTEVFSQDPVLRHPLSFDRYPVLAGAGWGSRGMSQVADWVFQGDNPVRRRVQELAEGSGGGLVREQAAMLLALASGKLEPVSANPSFEEGLGDQASGWSYWRKPDQAPEKPLGRISRSPELARDGKHALLCEGLLRGGPVLTLASPAPGRYLATAWVFAADLPPPAGTVELTLTPLDEQGRNLASFSSGQVQPQAGQWTLVTAPVELAPAEGKNRAARLRLVPIVDGFQGGGRVWLDDAGLFRWP